MMLLKSFMAKEDMFDNTVVLLPKNFSLENIILVSKILNYLPSLTTTLALSVAVTVLQLVSSIFVGYGFARFEFRIEYRK